MENNLPSIHKESSLMEIDQTALDLLKRTICKDSSDDEFNLFINVCKRTGLDPFARQIFAVRRWDSKDKKYVMAIQTSIDGFRLIAERTGKYSGQETPQWCGKDGKWTDVWLKDEAPYAARVGVIRSDFSQTVWAVARFDAYKQTYKDKQDRVQLSSMWAKMGDLMIAKCAEALALRKAFPQDLSGLYASEEMEQVASVVEREHEQTIVTTPKKFTSQTTIKSGPKTTITPKDSTNTEAEKDRLGDPGDFIMPFGKYQKRPLREMDETEFKDNLAWAKRLKYSKLPGIKDFIYYGDQWIEILAVREIEAEQMEEFRNTVGEPNFDEPITT